MLSKEICKRCINQRYPDNPWDKEDEYWWGEGYVIWCEGCVDIHKKPPKNCLYFLEQTLYSMSQETEVKQDAK